MDEVFQVVAVVGVALTRPPDTAAAAADAAGRSRAPPEEVRGAQLDALQTVHHLLSGEAEPARVEMRLNLNFLRWTLKSNSICAPWIATLSSRDQEERREMLRGNFTNCNLRDSPRGTGLRGDFYHSCRS